LYDSSLKKCPNPSAKRLVGDSVPFHPLVTLTKTEKKGKEAKTNFFTAVRESADAYPHVYVFAVEHMRNVVLKELRTEMKDTGRFFLGKNKVMVKALGGTMEEEYKENFHQVAEVQ
jgi:mRNA turnover protein 4